MSTSTNLVRSASPAASPRRWWAWAAPLALALAGVAVYVETLNAPLVFDDIINIVENDAVQRPTVDKLYHTGGRRIVAFVTFALNQEAHGLWPAGYRATNIAIHILAAIVLFDLVRLTLPRTSFGRQCAAAIVPTAFCAALLWVVHPLATQAVTYVVQRMESLASLFYLAALWGLARSATSQHAAPWLVLAVLCAWLGMATKETAVTLLLAALLLDRIFFAASWRELWRRRWAFYMALAPATLLLAASAMPAFTSTPSSSSSETAGVGMVEATPWEYLRSQPGVVLHYVRLALWPTGQCFDYAWPVARDVRQWLPLFASVVLVVIATLVLLMHRPQLGFLPAMFLLVLAPSSSILPIRDLAVEHRMYLPLAAIVVGVAIGGFALSERAMRGRAPQRVAISLAAAIFLLASVALGGVTLARNRVYLTEATLWRDVIAKAPHNPRGHYNLALKLQTAGDTGTALEHLRLALSAAEQDRATVRALISAKYGVTLAESGDLAAGLPRCEAAALLDPRVSEVQVQLGNARALAGDDRGALRAYQRAIEIRPSRIDAHFNLGQIAQRAGELELAEQHLAIAQQLNPKLPQIQQRLAQVRWRLRSGIERQASDY